jgi:hypothetical protein
VIVTGLSRLLAVFGLLTILTETAAAQQLSLTVTWTVTPLTANGWSGTKTLTVTNDNWVYSAA